MVNAMNYYSSQDSHLVAVDCIILGFSDNEMRLLVHNRAMEPAKGGNLVNLPENAKSVLPRFYVQSTHITL